jgi:hypothetical protein
MPVDLAFHVNIELPAAHGEEDFKMHCALSATANLKSILY